MRHGVANAAGKTRAHLTVTKGFSLYLDGMRALAAFVVVISHFAYERFTGGAYQWFRDYNFGSDAVIVFFVMSGLLIAYAADRSQGLADFTKARLSRLYSVVLPAIFLTLVLDAAGRHADPSLYQPPWDQGGSTMVEALRAATFTNEIWFWGSRLGTNGPYWSLAYEAWYYALFAVAFFTTGARRWALLILGAVVVGPRILLLAPCWIAGAILYRAYIRKGASPMPAPLALVLIAAPLFAYGALQAAGAPAFLYELTRAITGLNEPGAVYGFSNEFLWNYVLTGLIAAHLRGVIALPALLPAMPAGIRRIIRWPAQRSFALYLFHYPVISCLTALSPLDRGSLLHHASLGALTLIVCFALAEITERQRERIFRNRGALKIGKSAAVPPGTTRANKATHAA